MSKRFRGKDCVYCAFSQAADTRDHIFAQEFFPVGDRGNLPQVAACRACNSAKSVLEHCLVTLLPFGGDHPASSALLNERVPSRLAQNRKLHEQLATERMDVMVNRSKGLRKSLALPFDGDKLVGLFCFVA